MEIRDLRYFCLTAELEHVSKAADILGVSQPFLTKIIGQLENEIGAPLFDNVGRKIKLNKLGETFYADAKKILVDFDKLYADMDHLIDKHERTIEILSDTEAYSTALVLEFNRKYPDKILSITYGSRQEIIEALSTGKKDLAICTPPITDDPIKGLSTDIVFRERGCVLLPPDHPLIGEKNVSLEDLSKYNLITSPQGAGMRDNLDLLFKRYEIRPQIICESNDMGMVIKVVKSGLGYAFMPRSQMVRDPELWKYCVDLNITDATADIGISFNKNSNNIKNINEFREFVNEFFKSSSVDL